MEHVKGFSVNLPDPLVIVLVVEDDQEDHQHVHCVVCEYRVKMHLNRFPLNLKLGLTTNNAKRV